LRLYVANNSGDIHVVQLPTMKPLGVLKFPRAVNFLSLSPDGHFFCCVTDKPAAFIYQVNEVPQTWSTELIDPSTSSEIASQLQTLQTSLSKYPQYCAWSRENSRFVAVSQEDGEMAWFERITDKEKISFVRMDALEELDKFYNVRFCPNSSLLAVVTRRLLIIWDIHDKSNIQIINVPYEITGLTFSPKKSTLFVGTREGIFELRKTGVPSLVDVCVSYISTNKDVYWKDFNFRSYLTSDTLDMIFPDSGNEVKFKK